MIFCMIAREGGDVVRRVQKQHRAQSPLALAEF